MKLLAMAILLSILGPLTAAEPKYDPELIAKTIAPFIDDETLFVVRMDPRRVEVAALEKLFVMLPWEPNARQLYLTMAREWMKQYAENGGREIYTVYGATDFPYPPCIILPKTDTPAKNAALYESLKVVYGVEEVTSATINGFLCIGPKPSLERLKNRKASARPEFAKAFAACDAGIIQAVFVPTSSARKIFEQVVPALPAEVGGDPIALLTRDFQWATFTVGDPPKVPVRLVLQMSNEAAAKKLAKVFEKCVALQAKELPAKKDEPEDLAAHRLFESLVTWTKPEVGGPQKDQLTIALELEKVLPVVGKLLADMEPGDKQIDQNNLKQIGLACVNHASIYDGRLPANILDKKGNPLLSWRVAILPFIDQAELYRKFKLDEPWDSEHNQKLIPLMPKIYRSKIQNLPNKDKTVYLAPLGKGLAWDDPKGQKFAAGFPDGTSNTILGVMGDAEHAVVWTKPEDITIDPKAPAKGLAGHRKDTFMVLMADGSVKTVLKTYSGIYEMFTRNGGEILPSE